ncbi:hypothetical protein VCRA2119O147_1460008 [Vibrio crassostreae]|uniref:Uncharacterized protein n=1 Tax=Vibrio crassostreae TaxID=246167 RepID=A0A822N0L5_9VIBR|nr:hypothetical protein VCRA2112O187_1090006 [Vibrio crassostreae]CAK1741817.1 hypothetical protein VCRA2117O379_120091 [Vibrio crassostreae]CAK1742837.1 hypothetical protein VCRA2117O380_120091 [Vibrio crassostreae]CAK1743019.1 hypothetical protein VCRA2119O382_120091 [Vibrio crassostreae]CAK1827052.1 hypothetical protein VCRA2113O351_10085 [Vibrio crassostreae]
MLHYRATQSACFSATEEHKALTYSGLLVPLNQTQQIPQTKKDWYLYQSSLGGVSVFLPYDR